MSATDAHMTAPTRFIEANGVRYAYRRFGSEEGVPLIFLPHFGAGMDHWDPFVRNGLLRGQAVILFKKPGIPTAMGEPRATSNTPAMHAHALVVPLAVQTE